MIGKQYLNPATILHLKQQLTTYLEAKIHPHLSDLNGSLLGIDQSLEGINTSLRDIAGSLERMAETDRVQRARNEGVEPW